jgi:hypothetical protein
MKVIPLDNTKKLRDRPMFMYQEMTPAEAAREYRANHGQVARIVYAVTFPGGRVDCFIPWEGER